MKIKGLILIVSIITVLTACSQTNVGNIKLETADDSLAYAIGVSTYKGVTDAGWDIDPMVMAKAMIDAKEGNPIFNEVAANGFINLYGRQKQETEAKVAYAEQIEAGKKFLEENSATKGILVTPSGLQYKVLEMGDGAKPGLEEKVRVHYVGTLVDGTEFQSSRTNDEPAEFFVNQVIPGWTEGLQLMPVGSKFMFYIPYDLAYGPAGRGEHITPFCTLIFEVELLDILTLE